MIKRFRVPLIGKKIAIYAGERSYSAWVKTIRANGCDANISEAPGFGGRCWGGWIWVSDINDTHTVFHELAHVLSNIYSGLGCDDEEEFKAYISGYLIGEVYDFLENLKKNG